MIFNGIDFSLITDDEVLFFIRIRGKKSYFNHVYTNKFLQHFSSLKQFRTISEYRKDATVHIDLTSIERDWLTDKEMKSFEEICTISDIVLRCRGLRDIPYTFARKLVFRAYIFFDRFYSINSKLKLIVSGTVDNYVMDIMYKLGIHYGVKFIGVTDSFMSPEYKLITMRGESCRFSQPTDEEVNAIYEKIKTTILINRSPGRKRILQRSLYQLSSYIYRYTIRYLIFYKLQGKLGYEYVFAPLLRNFSSLDQLLALRYLKVKENFIIDPKKKYAYIPLHYVPEATIDYWVDDLYNVDYLSSILNTVAKLRDDGFEVIIKEHPTFYLSRFSDFYQKLVKSGCQILTPFFPVVEIFSFVDLIVVWNGSTGIEAIVRRKPVVKVSNSYYGDGIIPDLKDARNLPVPTDEMGKKVVKKVLESSFRSI
jgi:hypothetical protein